jgi:hypothetical protein
VSGMAPGEVVVCVDASPPRWHEPRYNLQRGGHYLVLASGIGWPRDVVELAGIPRHWLKAFDARRFRPLEPGEELPEQAAIGKARHPIRA